MIQILQVIILLTKILNISINSNILNDIDFNYYDININTNYQIGIILSIRINEA